MEALESRIESFNKSKRVKNSKSSKKSVKWPHPPTFKANPAALAEAGFYFNPSPEDKDNVACFECGKQLSEWEEDDDPFDLHWIKCGDKCSWAAVRCGLRGDMDRRGRFTFPDKARLPGSERMEKARLGTFGVGDAWVHDQSKGHAANSRKMAQAGFVWTPLLPGDDLATCLYCNISLSGWEEGDDPMEEHRKRAETSCPFLVYSSTSGTSSTMPTTPASPTTNKLTRSTSAKPPSKARAKPPSRSRVSRLTRGRKELAKENDVLEEEEDARISEEAEEDISDSVPAVKLVTKPTEAKKTRKGSRAPSARPSTRGVTRSESQPVPDTEGPARPRSRASRKPPKTQGKSTSRRKQEEVDVQDESEDFGASKRRTRKGRVIEDTDEHEDIPAVDEDMSAREDDDEIAPVHSQSRTSKKLGGRRAVKTQPPPTPPAVAVNPTPVEGDEVMSHRYSSNIKAKAQSTEHEPQTRRAVKTPSPTRPTVVVNSTPAKDDEVMSYHYPSNIKTKAIPQSTEDEPQTRLAIKTPSPSPTRSMVVVNSTPVEGGDVVSYRYSSNIQAKAIPQPTEHEPQTGLAVKTPSPPPTLPTVAVNSTPARGGKVVSIYSDHYLSSIEANTMPQSPTEDGPAVKAPSPLPAPPSVAVKATTPEPQILPALSRIPYLPLQTLTDAELDMTVEEWIRYQMEIEYDKLKRDGERELARFKARAEEARKIIENL